MLARSPTKNSAATPREVRRSQRIPLLESRIGLNMKASATDAESLNASESPTSVPRPKTLTKKASMSPAKRVPRAIQSPARREAQSQLKLDMSLRLSTTDTASTSPKKSLGSPMRQSSRTLVPDHRKSSSQTHLLSVSQLGTKGLSQSQLSLGSPERKSRLAGRHTAPVTGTRSSPLKRPARRVLSHTTSAPQEDGTMMDFAVLVKTGPAHDCLKEESHEGLQSDATKLWPAASVANDELSLLKPTKSTQRSKVLLLEKSPEVEISQGGKLEAERPSRIFEDAIEEDKDELAVTFTPIRTPQAATTVESPPSFDLLDADSDIWVPSVPVSLTTSFSHLKLTPDSKKSQHIHFDDSGEPKHSNSCSILGTPAKSSDTETGGLKTEDTEDSDLVVFVDCKASQDTGDSSAHFSDILSALGARTLQRWNWNPETQGTTSKRLRIGVTHVVFFNGTARTLRKVKEARQLGIDVQCVGLSWVMQCKKSRRLTIGTAGHEVDVDAELIKHQARRRSMEPSTLPGTPVSTRTEIKIDYTAPVKFDNPPGERQPCFSPQKLCVSVEAKMKTGKLQGVPPLLSEFETKQLALARRNSAKFRPPVSSPLSKKTWRA